MGSKSKYRIGVMSGGQARELLSIRQLTNGDLLVLEKSAENCELWDRNVKIKEKRYSVHRGSNRGAAGKLVKQTLRLEDGTLIENANLRQPNDGQFATIVFTKVCPFLGIDRYTLKKKKRDTVLLIQNGADVGERVLVYGLIVTDYPPDQKILTGANMSMAIIQFRCFYVTICWGCWAMPAIDGGDSVMLNSSMPRYNREPVKSVDQFEVLSLSPNELVSNMLGSRTMLRKMTYDRVLKTFPDADDTFKLRLEEGFSLWTPCIPKSAWDKQSRNTASHP